ncbi:MAG: peptide-methionine (R)-S-oxide reductase MsrB [Clostridia bacterium]
MGKKTIIYILAVALVIGLAGVSIALISGRTSPAVETATEVCDQETIITSDAFTANYADSRYGEIYLAGGCFWGVQAFFDRMTGVVYTNGGYANGKSADTDYQSIASTGHTEAVYVVYDPEIIGLEQLLEYFFSIIDPTRINNQGNDWGTQYRTGIYYVDEQDLVVIQRVKNLEAVKYSQPIATEVQPLRNYVLAEEYHQDYLIKNPSGYCHVDLGKIPNEKPFIDVRKYPKPSPAEIKAKLTDLQYAVTQEDKTEIRVNNLYYTNKEKGIYVDIVTGEPLFASTAKYDSGSGWPSFTRPIDKNVVVYVEDLSLGIPRVEVRSRIGDSHLGHVFRDGPVEEGGLRYCINSAAMLFIPYGEMDDAGYGIFKVYLDR